MLSILLCNLKWHEFVKARLTAPTWGCQNKIWPETDMMKQSESTVYGSVSKPS